MYVNNHTSTKKILSSSGKNAGGGGRGDSFDSEQPEYAKEQKADRVEVTKALSDQKNIEIMCRWGMFSSNDRRKEKGERRNRSRRKSI